MPRDKVGLPGDLRGPAHGRGADPDAVRPGAEGGAGDDWIQAHDGRKGNDEILGGGGNDRCMRDAGDTASNCP